MLQVTFLFPLLQHFVCDDVVCLWYIVASMANLLTLLFTRPLKARLPLFDWGFDRWERDRSRLPVEFSRFGQFRLKAPRWHQSYTAAERASQRSPMALWGLAVSALKQLLPWQCVEWILNKLESLFVARDNEWEGRGMMGCCWLTRRLPAARW